jgi:hypothetical protein
MSSKIYVIGDSFVIGCKYALGYNDEYDDWCKLLQSFNSDFELCVDGQPSRDSQTIIDNWIKLIPYINNTDYLIICIPTFSRTRLPLSQTEWNPSNINKNIINRFTGTSGYDGKTLLDEIDNSEKQINKLNYQKLINSTQSSILNQLEVIDSLIQLSKSKTIIFSWDNIDYNFEWMWDRKKIESSIGVPFHTLDDDWKESSGNVGKFGDLHWSGKYNRLFAIWINKLINKKEIIVTTKLI